MWVTGYCYQSRFGSMLELTMTSARSHKVPSIFFYYPQNFTYLHMFSNRLRS
jgi:hypothetical protein